MRLQAASAALVQLVWECVAPISWITSDFLPTAIKHLFLTLSVLSPPKREIQLERNEERRVHNDVRGAG